MKYLQSDFILCLMHASETDNGSCFLVAVECVRRAINFARPGADDAHGKTCFVRTWSLSSYSTGKANEKFIEILKVMNGASDGEGEEVGRWFCNCKLDYKLYAQLS